MATIEFNTSLTCGDCSSYPCDNSGGHVRKDKACNLFAPFEESYPIEDATGDHIGMLTLQRYGNSMKCVLRYPADGTHKTNSLEFHALNEETIDQISDMVFDHCEINNEKFVKLSISGILEDLQSKDWYPKHIKSVSIQAVKDIINTIVVIDDVFEMEEIAKDAFRKLSDIDLQPSTRLLGCKEIWKKCELDSRVFDVAYKDVFGDILELEKQEQKERKKSVKSEREHDKHDGNEIDKTGFDEITDRHRELANDIAVNGDPVEFLLATHQSMHVGDTGLAMTLFISSVLGSAINSEGFLPVGNGGSGTGKTHTFTTNAHLMPPKWILTSTISSKALFYMEDRLHSGMIIFSDDVGDIPPELEGLYKRIQSSWQTGCRHQTVDADRNIKELVIPPRVNTWITSVDNNNSIQLLNRQFGGETNESEEQDADVYRFTQQMKKEGNLRLPINDEVLTCRAIIDDIKNQSYVVKIPYADDVFFTDLSNRRNPSIFFDLIIGFALLRHRQREHEGDGVILADIQDYKDAETLYCTRSSAQSTKLLDRDRRILQALLNAPEKRLTRQQLTKKLECSPAYITQILGSKYKPDSGLLYKMKGDLELIEGTRTLYEDFTDKYGNIQQRPSGSVRQDWIVWRGKYNPLSGYDKAVYVSEELIKSINYELSSSLVLGNDSHRHYLSKLSKYRGILLNSFSHTNIKDSNNKTVVEPDDVCVCEVPSENSDNLLNSLNSCQRMPKDLLNSVLKTDLKLSDLMNVNLKHIDEPEVKEIKEPSPALIKSVHLYCKDWQRVFKASINTSNFERVASEYMQGHRKRVNPDMYDSVLFAVRKFADIDTTTMDPGRQATAN